MVKENQISRVDISVQRNAEPEQTMGWSTVSSFEDPHYVDLTDYMPEEEARRTIIKLGGILTAHALDLRDKVPEHAEPVPNIGRVVQFIKGLGITPRGRAYQVPEYYGGGAKLTDMGVSSPLRMQAYVIGENLRKPRRINPSLPKLTEELLAESTAVMQLTHLAGVPQEGYFIVDPNDPHQTVASRYSAPAFRHPTDPRRGGYYENGIAGLVGHKYLWEKFPQTAESSDTVTQTSAVTTIDIPRRHAFTDNTQACMAYGMEQLISMKPDIWDIFIESRQPGVDSEDIRVRLEAQVEDLGWGLYKTIENVDIRDKSDVLGATALITNVFERRHGRRL